MDSWVWILLLAAGGAVGTGVYFAMAQKQPVVPEERDIPVIQPEPEPEPAVLDFSNELISKKKGTPSKLDKLVKVPSKKPAVKYPVPNYSMANIQQTSPAPAPRPTLAYQWDKLAQATADLPGQCPTGYNLAKNGKCYSASTGELWGASPAQQNFSLPESAYLTPLAVPTNATL